MYVETAYLSAKYPFILYINIFIKYISRVNILTFFFIHILQIDENGLINVIIPLRAYHILHNITVVIIFQNVQNIILEKFS